MSLTVPIEERGFRRVAWLRAQLTDLGQAEFSARTLAEQPALVVVSPPAQPRADEAIDPALLFQQTHEEEEVDFQAAYADTVGLVQKRAQSPFPHMISLGRASNCDLVLFLPTVSKLHAYFQLGPEGWQVCDSRSRHGTFLNGARLAPGVPHALRCGDELRCGKATLGLRFRSPEGLIQRLRSFV